MIIPNTQNLQLVTVWYDVEKQTFTEYFETILCIHINPKQINNEDQWLTIQYVTPGGFVHLDPLSCNSEAENCHMTFIYDPILKKYIRREDQYTKEEMQEQLVQYYEMGIRIRKRKEG